MTPPAHWTNKHNQARALTSRCRRGLAGILLVLGMATAAPSTAQWSSDDMIAGISQCRQAITAETLRDYSNQVKQATGRSELTEAEAARFVRSVEPLLGVCECALDRLQHEITLDQLPFAGPPRIQALVASGECTVTVDRSQATN